MNLEDELRAALAPRPAPAGFAERVLARTERRHRRRPVYRWVGWAVAAGLVVACGLEYRRQAEGERAKEQAMLALRIAAQELNSVQAKMERIGTARSAGEER